MIVAIWADDQGVGFVLLLWFWACLIPNRAVPLFSIPRILDFPFPTMYSPNKTFGIFTKSIYWLTPTELFSSWVIRSQQPKSRGDILNSILIVVTRLTQKLFCYSLFSPVINSPTEAAKNKDSHKGLRQDAIVLPIFQRVSVRCISKS